MDKNSECKIGVANMIKNQIIVFWFGGYLFTLGFITSSIPENISFMQTLYMFIISFVIWPFLLGLRIQEFLIM